MRLIFLALFSLAAFSAEAAQDTARITGIVVDASGAPVAGATLTVNGTTATTSSDGTFEVNAPSGRILLQATATGFARASVNATSPATGLRLVLQPAPLVDAVVVTASRGAERLSTPAATTVVTAAELLNSAAGSLDDALRNTPGFSLFRRSSSRVSNPTTQGVTLRGVSGSGASRTLVLADGIPLNDPFGSWVYWNRVPLAAIERVEVVRGATGDLYGADALGGVVQVLTFQPGRTRLRLTADGGSQDTGRVSGFGSTERNGWFGEGAGEWLRTDGAFTIAPEVRGPIDRRADSDYGTGFFGGGYDAGRWHAGLRVSLYDESRGNGTPAQVNTTDWKQVSGNAAGTAGGGAWIVRGSGGTQDYYQTFSAVAADRATERLTTEQTTPSRFSTGTGQWTRGWGSTTILIGGEGRWTKSTVEEFRTSFFGVRTGPFFAGGNERNGAVFGRVSLVPQEQVTVVLGVRGDFWRSEPRDAALPSHTANFASPRASAAWRLSDAVSLQAATYRSYRTPSLNELHRGFRVGNIITNPNPLLDPERLTGAEGGVLFNHRGVSARATMFLNQLDGAITNVTLTTTPSLITRQRQNTDSVRASGLEVEADIRPSSRWTLGALAVVTSAHFRKTEQVGLEGNRVPQVPRFQLGGNLTYVDPHGFTGTVQTRVIGSQFDDDQNEFLLGRYGLIDISASQQLRRGLNAYVSVENLLDTDYDVGRTPLRTVGFPRSARVGVRVFLP